MQPELVRTCRASGPKTPESDPALLGAPWAGGGGAGSTAGWGGGRGRPAKRDFAGKGVGQVLVSRPGWCSRAVRGGGVCIPGTRRLSSWVCVSESDGETWAAEGPRVFLLRRELQGPPSGVWGRPPSEEGLPGTQSLPAGTAAAGKLFSGVLSGRQAAASGQASPFVSAPGVECFHK